MSLTRETSLLDFLNSFGSSRTREMSLSNDNPQQGANSYSFSSSPGQRLKIPPNKKDSRKLFVGGLPQNITNEEFVKFFSQYGELMDCQVMFDRESGRSRGFGFVTYVDPAVSSRLLKLGDNGDDNIGKVLMGDKMVEVKAAEPRPLSAKRTGKAMGPTMTPEVPPQTTEQAPFYYPPSDDMGAPMVAFDQVAPSPFAYGAVPAMMPGGYYPYTMKPAVASPVEANPYPYQTPMYYPVMMMPQPMPNHVQTFPHPQGGPMPPDQASS